MAKAHLFTHAGNGTLKAALVALVTMAAAACGGDDGDGGDPQRFIGTWTASSGQLSATCPGLPLPVPPDDLTGEKLTVTAGNDAPVEAEISGCRIKFDIKGDVATARPNQSCMIMYPTAAGSLNATLTVASATFTLKGASGDFAQSGSASVTIPGFPTPASCTYQITATAAK